MLWLSERMRGVARASTALGWFSIVLGLVITVLVCTRRSAESGEAKAFVVLAGLALYLVPGALALVFASHLKENRLWAYWCVFALGAFEFIKLFLIGVLLADPFLSGTRGLRCYALLCLPGLAVVAVCINAFQDVRDVYRQRRRERRNRPGFEPILKAPPPPARQVPLRLRRDGGRDS